MTDTETKVPVKSQTPALGSPAPSGVPQEWQPFAKLRREIDRLFDEIDTGFWHLPLRRSFFDVQPFWPKLPATDVVEKDKGYEITVELPGMDLGDVEVKATAEQLTIKGEKKEEKEETHKGRHLSERRFGAFERTFALPSGIDKEKIEATFKGGVLTVTLLKTPEAQKAETKIAIKAAA